MHYYQFHVADWALHTSHLTLVEEAVYRRLIDHYYNTESPIPTETQPVIRRLRLNEHSDTVAIILNEFFVHDVDGWHNRRADREVEAYRQRVERAKSNGKRGGRPSKINNLETCKQENPEETQPVISGLAKKTQTKANQEPRTKNQEPIKTLTPFAAVDESPSASARPKKITAIFDYQTGNFENLSDSMLAAWRSAYPAIDIRAEIAKAKVWLLANPKNRKSNIERFLTNWLTKAQDQAPRKIDYETHHRNFTKPVVIDHDDTSWAEGLIIPN